VVSVTLSRATLLPPMTKEGLRIGHLPKNKVPVVRAVRSQNLGGEARPAEPTLRHLRGLWPRPLRCSPMLCRLRRGGAKDLAREWPRQPTTAAEPDIVHGPMAAATSTHSKTIVRLCLSHNFDTE
jgi:hypothetical protein